MQFQSSNQTIELGYLFFGEKNIGRPDMCNSIEEDANKLKSEDQFSAKKDAHRPSAALLFDPSTPSEN